MIIYICRIIGNQDARTPMKLGTAVRSIDTLTGNVWDSDVVAGGGIC